MRCVKPTRAGFTLAEVLAALAFMAIVIPVAVQGIAVASRAGQVAARKADAARIGDRVLNELEVTGQLLSGVQSGVIQEGAREFHWSMQTQSWLEGNLNQVTVSVAFEVQGQAYDVQLATLIDPNATTTGTEVGQ
ncbi:MAG TPA: prepilin-type N-terminal cleavage/methylation domain-containing protein [Verrucomicrobiae bacterium]|nr:prepilin-type N-terminal cleavage/methylation domain-containing protein [Verrucomicrobiae bacterium]